MNNKEKYFQFLDELRLKSPDQFYELAHILSLEFALPIDESQTILNEYVEVARNRRQQLNG